jgi:hypothetical protein
MAKPDIEAVSRRKCISQKKPPPTAQRLKTVLRNAWVRETSYDPAHWSTGNPSWGQCAVTALLVQDHCGGSIMSGEVNGKHHYWNRLPTNEELDLTLQQFGNEVHRSKAHPCDREYILSFSDTTCRYQQLQNRVRARLAGRSVR